MLPAGVPQNLPVPWKPVRRREVKLINPGTQCDLSVCFDEDTPFQAFEEETKGDALLCNIWLFTSGFIVLRPQALGPSGGCSLQQYVHITLMIAFAIIFTLGYIAVVLKATKGSRVSTDLRRDRPSAPLHLLAQANGRISTFLLADTPLFDSRRAARAAIGQNLDCVPSSHIKPLQEAALKTEYSAAVLVFQVIRRCFKS
ncbi:hypothetical protein B0H16DRAFT_1454507 [Mycena metata]|nr:hypothetical protein B0H16DRAFT_1454507 [Mycena metata]